MTRTGVGRPGTAMPSRVCPGGRGEDNAVSDGSDLVTAKLDAVWSSIIDLCSGFEEPDWDRDTDCPGWTVKDHLSHLVGGEAALAGLPAPSHEAPSADWVRNAIGQVNENAVDERRARPGAEVLEEFRTTVGTRLAQLRAMSDADFAEDSWTPIGPGSLLDFLQIRVLDAWVHEQDIRAAVQRPGGADGPVAEHAVDRLLGTVPMVVGKRAGAPEGAVVVLELDGPVRRTATIEVVDGRALPVDGVAGATPTVRTTMSSDIFARLSCGRLDPALALGSGSVRITGDELLGRAVVGHLNTMI